jgi:GR25 family glycosyltransferase involved in LPS biosynthesis
MNISDINVLYINLAYRLDRNRSIRHNLEKYGFDMKKVHRIDAVLNSQCGHIGCGNSHIIAIKMAIEKGWDKVLVLEDDFVFDQPVHHVERVFKSLDPIKWDVILLADGHKNVKPCEYSFLKRVIRCTTTSGYIIRKHYYETLLKNFEDAVCIMNKQLQDHIQKEISQNKPITKLNYCSAIDQHWWILQSKDTFYLCSPTLGSQKCGYSDNNCSFDHQKNMIEKSKNVQKKIMLKK